MVRSVLSETRRSILILEDTTNFSCIIITNVEAIRNLLVRAVLLLVELYHLQSLQIGHFYRFTLFLDSFSVH